METYRIGEIIREERKRKKISQEELCFGICSVTTLSRIENGNQKPSLKVEEALLERLGHSTENLIFYADENEIKKYHLEDEIRMKMMIMGDVTDLLNEYQKIICVRGTEASLEKQFFLMSFAIQNLYMKNKSLEEVRIQLFHALRLTIPDYEDKMLEKINLFTSTEIEILNNLALVYAKEKKSNEAIYIFRYLANSMERNQICNDVRKKHYNMLICNLVKQLEVNENYEEAEIYSQKGIDYCKKCKKLNGFPELLYYNAVANSYLGRNEKAAEGYEQAIALFKLIDRKTEAKEIEEEQQRNTFDNQQS